MQANARRPRSYFWLILALSLGLSGASARFYDDTHEKSTQAAQEQREASKVNKKLPRVAKAGKKEPDMEGKLTKDEQKSATSEQRRREEDIRRYDDSARDKGRKVDPQVAAEAKDNPNAPDKTTAQKMREREDEIREKGKNPADRE